MIRRAGLGLIAAAAALACGDNSTRVDEPLGPVVDPLEWVDPAIGSGGYGYAYGSAFVGAAAPHGLVKLGPDTSGEFGTIGFQHFSGYFAEDDTVETFSHMHLHGAGASDYGLIGVMPTGEFDPARTRAEQYASRFDKATEIQLPGRYAVRLERSGVDVELTATTRAGHHRYRFAADVAEPTLVLDLSRSLEGGAITSAAIELDAASQAITGELHSEGRMSGGYGGHPVYFAARTREPWVAAYSWADTTRRPRRSGRGAPTGPSRRPATTTARSTSATSSPRPTPCRCSGRRCTTRPGSPSWSADPRR